MRFSFNWIKEYTNARVTPQEMADLLSAKSFEVDEVVEKDGDFVLNIDVLANRPDSLSHIGVARDVAVLTGSKFVAKEYKPEIAKPKDFSIKIQDGPGCPRYSALIIRGVKVGPSPKKLVDRLELLGLKSINNIVDATNYVMLETGQPLHAFDLAKLDGIVVRRAGAGEKIKTLDEAQTEFELDPSILVIADKSKPVAIAGIKGGWDTGITDSTKDILIEAANFDPEIIRAGSKKLRLRTDASVRFSYGVDPELPPKALARAAELIADVAGGKADSAVLDNYEEKWHQPKIKLDGNYVRSLLGEDIKNELIVSTLTGLGFEVSGEGEMIVACPSWRTDVRQPEDLIEEIGRVYGYDNIKAKPPMVSVFDDRQWTKSEVAKEWDDLEYIRERGYIAHLLASIGFTEVYNYSLISDELKEAFDYSDLSELENPISHEYKYLRPSLLPRLALNVRENFRFFDEIRLFETGHVFENSAGPEPRRLAIAIGRKDAKASDIFFELKSYVDLLMHKMGITDIWYDSESKLGQGSAEIKTEEDVILGSIKVLSPQLCERLKIKGRIAVAEMDLKKLIEHFQNEREFEPLPKYPAIVRDIAVLVEPEVRVDDILNIVEQADSKKLIRDIDVFDIYEPEPSEMPARTGQEKRKKSVAFHVVFRADDHTLTDQEAESVEKEIKRLLQENLGAEVR